MARTWKRTSDSCVAPDKPFATVIAKRLVDNIAANAAELQVSTTHVYSAAGNRAAPTVSTPPSDWWGIPLLVPVAPGCAVVKVTLRYTVATASVKARLIGDGRWGDVETLATTGTETSATSTLALSDAAARRVRVLVAFQSQAAASPLETITGVTATSRLTPMLHAVECTTSGTYSGKTHMALKYTEGTAERWIYIGAADSAAGVLYSWYPDALALDSADLHAVGTITVKSLGLRVVGDGSTGSFAVPSHAPMQAGRTVRASDLLAMWRAAWAILRDRAKWWAAGPGLDSTSHMHGVRINTNAAACYVRRRVDTKGVEVGLYGVPLNAGALGATVRFKTLGGVNETATIEGSGTMYSPASSMTTAVSTFITEGTWGGEDLVPERELAGLSPIAGAVPWPDSIGVGDYVTVTVESQKLQHTHGVCIREWYDDEPPQR